MAVKNGFEFVRLVGEERRVADTLAGVSRHWKGNKERFLFISPHDDDAVIGGGLMIQLALREKVPVYVLIVTDGSMGYCHKDEADSISDIRRRETFACYRKLGVPKDNIIWMGFPDCNLAAFLGRRRAHAGLPERVILEGHTGLQNAFTYYLRKVQPTQVFIPTSADLHPDHRMVNSELMISAFHASGAIWPELGKPLRPVPHIHEMAIYCDFPTLPKLRVQAPERFLEKKIQGVLAFKSQEQIGDVVDIVRSSGPREYLRPVEFTLYQPSKYKDLFDEKPSIRQMR
jgi:LmbE family N-acetylglucosaminyl deacetylase